MAFPQNENAVATLATTDHDFIYLILYIIRKEAESGSFPDKACTVPQYPCSVG
jgi:hypothetical protein